MPAVVVYTVFYQCVCISTKSETYVDSLTVTTKNCSSWWTCSAVVQFCFLLYGMWFFHLFVVILKFEQNVTLQIIFTVCVMFQVNKTFTRRITNWWKRYWVQWCTALDKTFWDHFMVIPILACQFCLSNCCCSMFLADTNTVFFFNQLPSI